MTHDEWRLLRYGLLTALLIVLILWPLLANNQDIPKSEGEAIVGAVALAVFALSKYMEWRKKSK